MTKKTEAQKDARQAEREASSASVTAAAWDYLDTLGFLDDGPPTPEDFDDALDAAIYDELTRPLAPAQRTIVHGESECDDAFEARVSTAAVDEVYWGLVRRAADALDLFEGDIYLHKPETVEAVAWLGNNHAVLEYMFSGSAAPHYRVCDDNGQLITALGRGMVEPPRPSGGRLAIRGLLHSRLANKLSEATNLKVRERFPEDKQPGVWPAIERVVNGVFKAHMEHLRRRHEATANPIYAWHAIGMFVRKGIELPEWAVAYLGKSVDALEALSEHNRKLKAESIAVALGFSDDSGCFAENVREAEAQSVAVGTYKFLASKMEEHGFDKPPIKMVGEKVKVGRMTAQRQFDAVDRLVTGLGEDDNNDFPDENINRVRTKRTDKQT
jgi:hypothetical protein